MSTTNTNMGIKELNVLEKGKTIIDESILLSLDNRGVVLEEDVSNYLPENFRLREDNLETSERKRNPLKLSFENLAKKYEERQEARLEQTTKGNIEPQIEKEVDASYIKHKLDEKHGHQTNFEDVSLDQMNKEKNNVEIVEENENILKSLVCCKFRFQESQGCHCIKV